MTNRSYVWFLLLLVLSCARSSDPDESKSEDAKKNSKSEDSKKTDPNEYDLTKCGMGTNLTYENFGENLFFKHCLSCHNEKNSKVDLSSLDQLHVWKNSILALAVQDNKMPPDYNLAASEKELLLEWISCGLP